MDNVRGGLEDIGAAALHGSQSFKQAVVQMIEQLAEMSLRLYILRPLIESVFGKGGTDAGFLNQLLGIGGLGGGATPDVGAVAGGYAAGGRPPVGRPSWVGERGKELFIPDTPGTIIPNIISMPNIASITHPQMSLAQNITIDARGAQAGVAEQIEAAITRAAPHLVGASVAQVNKNFPAMMHQTMQRHF